MRTRSCLATYLAATFATISLSAQAAQISTRDLGPDVRAITIVGSIEIGDSNRFDQVAAATREKQTVVILTSPGGSLIDGLTIGEKLRTLRFTTFVQNECSSVCSLIWLAGTVRYVDESSAVGFHAVYTKDGTNVRESGWGNAMVGAYLTRLGLDYAAVEYATSAPPEKITWMTAADALRMNINVKYISKLPAAGPARAATAAVESPVQSAETVNRAELNDRLNASELRLRKEVGDEKVDATVAFIKAAVARDPSLSQKLSAQPDPYRWALRLMEESPSLGALPDPSAMAHAAAALTPGYARGRDARMDYERWFTNLPAGRYKDGASFWASNRSLKPSRSCTNTSEVDWQSGCTESRTRLAPSDVLRAADPNYRWGWNNL